MNEFETLNGPDALGSEPASGRHPGRDALGLVLFALAVFLGVSVFMSMARPQETPEGSTAFFVGVVGLLGVWPLLFLSIAFAVLGGRLWVGGQTEDLLRNALGALVGTLALSFLAGAISHGAGGGFGNLTGGAVARQLTAFAAVPLGLVAVAAVVWFTWLRSPDWSPRISGRSQAPEIATPADSEGITAAEAEALLPVVRRRAPAAAAGAAEARTRDITGKSIPIDPDLPPLYPPDVRLQGGIPKGTQPIEAPDEPAQTRTHAAPVRSGGPVLRPAAPIPPVDAGDDPFGTAFGATLSAAAAASEAAVDGPALPDVAVPAPRWERAAWQAEVAAREPIEPAQSSGAAQTAERALADRAPEAWSSATGAMEGALEEDAFDDEEADELESSAGLDEAELDDRESAAEADDADEEFDEDADDEESDEESDEEESEEASEEEELEAELDEEELEDEEDEEDEEDDREDDAAAELEDSDASDEDPQDQDEEDEEDDLEEEVERAPRAESAVIDAASAELAPADEIVPAPSGKRAKSMPRTAPDQPGLFDEEPVDAYGTPASLVDSLRRANQETVERLVGEHAQGQEEPERTLAPQPPPDSRTKPEAHAKPEARSKPAAPASETVLDEDGLLFRAGELFVQRGRVAVSMLQREFGMDFKTATAMLDRLQDAGLIGPYLGGQRRDILLTLEEWRARVGVS